MHRQKEPNLIESPWCVVICRRTASVDIVSGNIAEEEVEIEIKNRHACDYSGCMHDHERDVPRAWSTFSFKSSQAPFTPIDDHCCRNPESASSVVATAATILCFW